LATTYTWLGAAGDDWFTKADWSPAGPPSAGSAVAINGKPGPTLNNGDAALAHLSVTFAGAGANNTSNGGTFGATFSLIDAAVGATALNIVVRGPVLAAARACLMTSARRRRSRTGTSR
jgi:hypothetical protein